MKQKILTLLFTLILIVSSGSVERVLACSCAKYEPQEVYNSADIVFIGKAIDGLAKVKGEKDHYFSSSEISTFEVSEAFVGVKKGEKIRVDGGSFVNSCQFSIPFFTNNEYLIYASKDETNVYVTNYCRRSKMTDASGNEQKDFEDFLRRELMEDLEFLREELPLKRSGKLSGRIMQNDYESSFANVKLKIRNNNDPQKVIFVKSDNDGDFSVELPEGEYRVELDAPKRKKLTESTIEELKSIRLRRGGAMKIFIDLEEVKKPK